MAATPFLQTYFHGTKADLKIGEFIEPGLVSNYGKKNKAKYIYLTATLDAAIWGAELALGDEKERIYLVEPSGELENDPNLTDKKSQETLRSLIVLSTLLKSLEKLRFGKDIQQNK